MRNLASIAGCVVICLLCSDFATGQVPWADTQQSDEFQFHSEFALENLRPAIAGLRQQKADLEQLLSFRVTSKAVEVTLFQNRRNYQNYLAQRTAAGGSRRALYIKGPDQSYIYLYQQAGIENFLRHECTHAMLHNSLPYLPLWMDEGLATYFEPARNQRLFGHYHLKTIKLRSRFGWVPSLRTLEEKDSVKSMTKAAYRDSWAWVHFLFHESPESRATLTSYLQSIRQGNPPGRFSDWAATRIPNLEKRFQTHFQKWKPQ